MTGNTEERGANDAEWLAAVQTLLTREVEAMVAALPGARPVAGADSAALDRHARAVIDIARAARTAAGLTQAPGRGTPAAAGEDMNKKADDISPERLQQICEQIVERSGRLRAAYERKRAADGVSPGGSGEPARGPGAHPGSGTA